MRSFYQNQHIEAPLSFRSKYPKEKKSCWMIWFSASESIHSNFFTKKEKPEQQNAVLVFGPSVEIRTRGLLNPIQARYQTSPHPDISLCSSAPKYNSISCFKNQVLFFTFLKFFHTGISRKYMMPDCRNLNYYSVISSFRKEKPVH